MTRVLCCGYSLEASQYCPDSVSSGLIGFQILTGGRKDGKCHDPNEDFFW